MLPARRTLIPPEVAARLTSTPDINGRARPRSPAVRYGTAPFTAACSSAPSIELTGQVSVCQIPTRSSLHPWRVGVREGPGAACRSTPVVGLLT